MTHLSRITLTLQKFSWRPTTTMTITVCSVHCQHQLLGPQLHRDLICHPKRWTLPHASSNACHLPIMNLRSIFSFLKKTLTLATLFPGGLVTILNFPISPILLMMCSEFQALHILSHYRPTFNFFPCLPGSAVAVKHIFSGGHDVISFWRARLDPDTIHTLMVVKQHLQLAWNAITDVIGD